MATTDSFGTLSPVLIANRSEIAVRVARSVHALGLRSVAVYTDADAGSLHLEAADMAVRIGSYLDAAEIIDAAARSGARAIHPGYGFLSENAAFARAAIEAGLVWIGPPPEAIELMGDKGRAKRLAAETGVPVVPGTTGEQATRDQGAALAAEHGFPLVIKALAGGGGKGMRVVRSEAEIGPALAAAAREADAAFGDGRVLAERYLDRPRHIEVQVLADRRGNVVHLGERECSLQRRHQKVIEEAPSPIVDEGMRERMGAAAVALARACAYEGAGTVEFIAPSDGGDFFFLEMNTRLQVEHPVTEAVWGVDLVEAQLRAAAGEPLPFAQDDLRADGHAVEARLYAEDPAAGFLPSVGTVAHYREPTGAGVRVDSGIRAGSVVGSDYDPLLAKLIAHGPDRATALGRLDRALAGFELLGVAHSAAFTRALLSLPEVVAGELDTGLLERALEQLDLEPPDDLLAAAAIACFRQDIAELSISAGPWRRRFEALGEVRISGSEVSTAEGTFSWESSPATGGALLITLDGIARRYAVTRDGVAVRVGRDGHQLEARFERPERSGAAALAGSLQAPMPGTVLLIDVGNGELVSEGDRLMVLESMKMELQITAPHAGTVEGLELAVGDKVALRQPLVAIAPLDAVEEERR